MTGLASWNDTATREAIESYVENATGDRVAVFDNDGTLWCEKPMPIQLDFTLRRWAAMAEADSSLRVLLGTSGCGSRRRSTMPSRSAR